MTSVTDPVKKNKKEDNIFNFVCIKPIYTNTYSSDFVTQEQICTKKEKKLMFQAILEKLENNDSDFLTLDLCFFLIVPFFIMIWQNFHEWNKKTKKSNMICMTQFKPINLRIACQKTKIWHKYHWVLSLSWISFLELFLKIMKKNKHVTK